MPIIRDGNNRVETFRIELADHPPSEVQRTEGDRRRALEAVMTRHRPHDGHTAPKPRTIGQKRSDETKARMRQAQLARWARIREERALERQVDKLAARVG